MNLNLKGRPTSLIFVVLVFFEIGKVICKSNVWNYLVFAQRWPSAACLDIPHGKCSVPSEVNDWIIHGLWPTSEKGYPSFCNNSWPFNVQDIKPIYKELNAKWPNIIASSSTTAFWKHEWVKHGTCATSVKELDGILKYFKRSLELHDALNVYELLRKVSITPDEAKVYMLKSIQSALHLHLNATATVFCKQHKDYNYPLLDTVYLCMNKKFELIDCNVQESSCKYSYITYLPFKKASFCFAA